MAVRVLCDVLGVEGHEPEQPLGPFLPPIVQLNTEPGAVAPGDVVRVVLHVRVRQIIPAPIQDGEA